MDDDAREALEREMVERFLEDWKLAARTPHPDLSPYEYALSCTFRRLLTTHAIVPREMTAGQDEVLDKVGEDFITASKNGGDAPVHDYHYPGGNADAHAAYIAAGEVKLFGEGA